MVPARIDFVEPLGSHVLVTAIVDEDRHGDRSSTRIVAQAPADTALDPGTRVGFTMAPERTYFFDAETGDARRSRERYVTAVRPQ